VVLLACLKLGKKIAIRRKLGSRSNKGFNRYVGTIAQKFGGRGGDVGIYLSGAITLVVYLIARTAEKNYSGK
jgi:hypothetical protein